MKDRSQKRATKDDGGLIAGEAITEGWNMAVTQPPGFEHKHSQHKIFFFQKQITPMVHGQFVVTLDNFLIIVIYHKQTMVKTGLSVNFRHVHSLWRKIFNVTNFLMVDNEAQIENF